MVTLSVGKVDLSTTVFAPAYDMESHPSIMVFRTDQIPGCWCAHGETVLVIYDTYRAFLYDPQNIWLWNEIDFSEAEYLRFKQLYERGRNNG